MRASGQSWSRQLAEVAALLRWTFLINHCNYELVELQVEQQTFRTLSSRRKPNIMALKCWARKLI
jgi:hypothetical protein